MKNLILSLVILFMSSNLFAQSSDLKIQKIVTTTELTQFVLLDNVISQTSRNLGDPVITESPAKVVRVTGEKATIYDSNFNRTVVDTIASTDPEDQRPLVYLSEKGEYLVFDGEVSSQSVTVGPPAGQFDEIENLAKDLAAIVADPQHASKYLSELEAVSFDGDLQSVKIRIGQARQNASRGGVGGQWYKFFQPLDIETSKATTVEDYELMWRAVIRGLKSYMSTNSYLPSSSSLPAQSESPIIYLNQQSILP